MAELNYNDMVRAVQDGSRNLQDRLQDAAAILDGSYHVVIIQLCHTL